MGTSAANADVLICRARSAFAEAYAELQDLPDACRQAIEIIYRELGSGVSASKAQAMHAHTAGCERCGAEYRRAHMPRYLRAIAFLFPSGGLWPTLGKAGVGIALAAAVASPSVVDRIPIQQRPFHGGLPGTESLVQSSPKSTSPQEDHPAPSAGEQAARTLDRHDHGEHSLAETSPLRECTPSGEGAQAQHEGEAQHESLGGGTHLGSEVSGTGSSHDSADGAGTTTSTDSHGSGDTGSESGSKKHDAREQH
jgi:hypothetical protein